MVAAAKLRRAQSAAEHARGYAEKLTGILAGLGGTSEHVSHPFLREAGDGPVHVVVVSSDRGLCGGYNANIIKVAEEFLEKAEDGTTLTVCGRRARDYFAKRDAKIVQEHVAIQELNVDLAREIGSDASRRFLAGDAARVMVAYTQFKSAISQTPVVEQLLPIAGVGDDDSTSEAADSGPDYVYEPSAGAILQSLLPRYLETKLFHAMLESNASEHGARMTAMDSATRNASEMIDKLTLEMNRARQASITTELMEIVGGAEALKG